MCNYEIDWAAIAAWVQGLGSLAALGVAIWVYCRQRTDTKNLERKRRKEEIEVATAFLFSQLLEMSHAADMVHIAVGQMRDGQEEPFELHFSKIDQVLDNVKADMSTWTKLQPSAAVALGNLFSCLFMHVQAIDLVTSTDYGKNNPSGPADLLGKGCEHVYDAIESVVNEIEETMRNIGIPGLDSALIRLRSRGKRTDAKREEAGSPSAA